MAPAFDETALPSSTVQQRDITYVERATGPVKFDLFTPPGDGPFPLVIWIHGGAWKLGSKSEWSHMNFLAGEGYAIANVEYRFSQVAPFPAQLDDCSAALDYVVEHARELKLDPARIAVSGESAGGHLAALLGMTRASSTTQPTGRIRAVIDLFGPTDMAGMAARPSEEGVITQLLGGPIETKRELARQASPLEHVSKDAPPFLILHGSADPLVPLDQSQRLANALTAVGVKAQLVTIDGAGHAGPAFWTETQREAMRAFLKETLAP
ncbi:MAG: alpha/beta hydrolase [Tepidisphaeraceae bacterium]